MLAAPAAGARTWVARDADGIVGLTTSGPGRDVEAPTEHELYAINVLARAHGTGLGAALLEHAVGDRAAYLWVLDGNARAAAFYRGHGFADDGGRKPEPNTGLVEIRMSRGPVGRPRLSDAALALVLAAALLHATWNLAAKGVGSPRVAFIWLYVVVSALIWVPIGVVWVVVSGDPPTWTWAGAATVSAGLHIVYQLALQRGYAESDLNLVYPLARGTGPLLTFVVAATVLGQRPGPVAFAGVVAIVSGVLLISLGPAHGRARAGAAWGLATGVTIASYTLWDNHAVTALAVPPLPYFVLGIVVQLPVLAVLLRREGDPTPLPEVWRDTRVRVLAVAICSPLAYILVLRAMQLAPVALVAAGREASIVVGALFGWLVLREARPARRLVGAAMVLLGIGLIAVS